VKAVMPDVVIMGCVFHWTQAVWRKVSCPHLTIRTQKKTQ